MGATLVAGGATFRVWTPDAARVYVVTGGLPSDAHPHAAPGWAPEESAALEPRGDGTWAGFVPGVADGSAYRFWVVGSGSSGFKRDPYAREMGTSPGFPNCDCVVRDPAGYPWHDAGWRAPDFHDLVVYQLHVGVFHAVDADGRDARRARSAGFLDLLHRVEYLRDLGVNAIQPMPVQTCATRHTMGYNATDYFAPAAGYQVTDEAELARHLAGANALLAAHGAGPLTLDEIRPAVSQLKLLVDVCHLNGIAVILDLVYNHAGGDFGDESLYFMDRRAPGGEGDSLYFTGRGWAGGRVFDYANPGVRQFLIDNARFFLDEYHADGIRYDEASVMDDHGGWSFCQDLTDTVRFANPRAVQIAEYWSAGRWLAVVRPPAGMGFDVALGDRLRESVRGAVEQAAGGADAAVDMRAVGESLRTGHRFPAAWTAVQCVENHDVVYRGRQPRIAALADPSDARSWYARSRSRVATGLVLTAPGIPMLFMGQEILEDKPWSDNPDEAADGLVWWEGLDHDPAMRDHHAFTRDLVRLRRSLAALRGEAVEVFHTHDANRVVAFHRWSGEERVVVAASLSETTVRGYELGFPAPGRWTEVFNSDHYDSLPNPWRAGNDGGVDASGPPLHGLPCSAAIVLPANALVVFTQAP